LKTIQKSTLYTISIIAIYFIISFILFLKIGGWDGIEGFMSAAYSDTLYPISRDYYLTDTPLLLAPFLYSIYSKFFFEIQIHSFVSYGIAFLCIIEIFKMSRKISLYPTSSIYNKELLSILVLVLLTPNLLALSTTRNAMLVFTVFAIKYYKNFRFSWKNTLIFTSALILRLDAILLLSFFFAIILIVKDWEIKLKYLAPYLISLLTYGVFNIYLKLFASESYQTFYFYELELFDKINFSLNQVSKEDALQLYYYVFSGIINDQVFTLDFYKRVVDTNYNHIINSFFNLRLFLNTFMSSIEEILLAKNMILLSFISLIILLAKRKPTLRFKTIFIILFNIPVIACFYIILPNRFLSPYYSIISIIYIFCIAVYYQPRPISLFALIMVAFSCSYNNVRLNYEKVVYNQKIYENTISKVKSINTKYPEKKLFTGNIIGGDYMFIPFKASSRTFKTNIHFINYFLFSTLDSFKDEWKEICNCNPYSLKEKLEYIANTHSLILIDEKMTVTYSKYYRELYNQELVFKEIDPEIEELYTIQIKTNEF
jgi:hypothetical protein